MDQKDQKPEAPEIVTQSRFLRWLDNIWYHYKWHIIIGAFAILTLVICLVQCSSRKSYDMTVVFAGGSSLTVSERDGVCSALEMAVNSEEVQTVQLITYGIYTEQELLGMYSSENAVGNRVIDDFAYGNAKKQNIDEGQSFSSFLRTGECAVWLISPYVYEQYGMETLATPLSEIFGDAIPSSAANACAVRLGDTAIYQTYSALQKLPADTLIVLTRPYVFGNVSKDGYYENCRRFFLLIANF